MQIPGQRRHGVLRFYAMRAKEKVGRRKAEGTGCRFSLFPLLFSLCSTPAAAATAAENYMTYCALCHLPGIHGAPKVGDQADWTQRVRAGLSMVYRNAIEGMPNTAMLPLGSAPLAAAEVKAIVDHMLAATALPAAALQEAARYDKLGITDRDFIRHDANYDGFLTREELAGDPVLLQGLTRFDSNADGRLSEAEYVGAETTLARERAAAQVDDSTLEIAVRKALAGVRGVDFQYAKVEVRSGVVAIIGIVEHASVAIRAQDAVKRIAGVKKIDNRLVSGDQIGWD
jgi:cytochrome c5